MISEKLLSRIAPHKMLAVQFLFLLFFFFAKTAFWCKSADYLHSQLKHGDLRRLTLYASMCAVHSHYLRKQLTMALRESETKR